MKTPNLQGNDCNYIRQILQKDIEEIAADISFFEQLNLDPKDFIDERIALCKKFDIDFWQHVDNFCSDYNEKRLRAIYEGVHLLDFIVNYEMPTEDDRARKCLQMIKGKSR